MDNKIFVEEKMKELYDLKFVDKKELTAVTGLLPGGVKGDLKNNDGSIRYTRAIDANEYFTRQNTPYIYPLLKGHKLPLEELKSVKPEEVCDRIPARLVVGMSSCQLSRIQAWLESFLTPLSKIYGEFEYTKDSTDILIDFEKINQKSASENWNLDDILMFGIDVQALYPSIQFEHLETALNDCLDTCTNWSNATKRIIIDLIMYTLRNQQLYWNQSYYMLNKGIPTGGKHCVPLANIFLSYIIKDLLRKNVAFRNRFAQSVKLWKRYIDDCGGLFAGIRFFRPFFKTLEDQFALFGLKLTHEVSKEKLILLDIQIYKEGNRFNTKEHRKETASNSYIKFGSSHPSHSFKGIIKSQMYRLRRLCSKDSDFVAAVAGLKTRCLNSGYDKDLVENILSQANTLQRTLTTKDRSSEDSDVKTIRWVILAGTFYERRITDFTRNINNLLRDHKIKLEIVKSTGTNLGQLLFNNREKYDISNRCNKVSCSICINGIRVEENKVASKITSFKYNIDSNLNCENCGIYRIICPCSSAYNGKTTTEFGKRFPDHFKTYRESSVFEHTKTCPLGKNKEQFKIYFLENCLNRGKYTLSEREYLWNERLGGEINIQKILKSS